MGPVGIVVVLVVLAGGAFLFLRGRGSGGGSSLGGPASRPMTADAAPGVADAETRERTNWLVGVGGDVAGKKFYVGQRVVTIGRAPTNQVQTTDPEASRKHCQLTPNGAVIKLVDMSSRNGTEINGTLVKQAALVHGDRIRIGDAELVFVKTPQDGADASLDRKVASTVAQKKTALGDDADLSGVIGETIRKCDGDLERAAEVLGCDVAFLERLVEKEKRSGS